MVAGDEDGEVWRLAHAAVILVEISKLAILLGYGHGVQISGIADGLEIASDDEEVDAIPSAFLGGLFCGGVNGVECAVALSLVLECVSIGDVGKMKNSHNPRRRCARPVGSWFECRCSWRCDSEVAYRKFL